MLSLSLSLSPFFLLRWVFVAAGGLVAEHKLSGGGMWPRFCSCPHGPWWLTVQPEEEGGKGEGTGPSFPLRPWLKSYMGFHLHPAGLNACLVATPSYKGVQKM